MRIFFFPELKHNTVLLNIADNTVVQNAITQTILPILESWSGQKISPNIIVYGIRRYLRDVVFIFS